MECLICYNEVQLRQYNRCNNCDKLICLNCNILLNECPFCKFNFNENSNPNHKYQCKECKIWMDEKIYFCDNCFQKLNLGCFCFMFWKFNYPKRCDENNKWFKRILYFFCCLPIGLIDEEY